MCNSSIDVLSFTTTTIRRRILSEREDGAAALAERERPCDRTGRSCRLRRAPSWHRRRRRTLMPAASSNLHASSHPLRFPHLPHPRIRLRSPATASCKKKKRRRICGRIGIRLQNPRDGENAWCIVRGKAVVHTSSSLEINGAAAAKDAASCSYRCRNNPDRHSPDPP